MNCIKWYIVSVAAVGAFVPLTSSVSVAAKVVVVPLSGTVGDAAVTDVVKGKTFSSKTAGKGKAGTLEIRDGSIIYSNSIGMKLSLIPAGSFIMGSPDSTADAAHPPEQVVERGWDYDPLGQNDENQHQVTLTKSFYMQTTEVTQGQWESVMGVNSNPSFFSSCGGTCPVEMVSWNDAQSFINALNVAEGRAVYLMGNYTCLSQCYSLPTEAQWEYAARAGTVTAFYNGDMMATNVEDEGGGDSHPSNDNDSNLTQIAWYDYNSSTVTHPVGEKQANNWGLYDMSGNVEEWCQDWYLGGYSSAPASDPQGPSTGAVRTIRGGSYIQYARYERSAARSGGEVDYKIKSLGFRIILPSP